MVQIEIGITVAFEICSFVHHFLAVRDLHRLLFKQSTIGRGYLKIPLLYELTWIDWRALLFGDLIEQVLLVEYVDQGL